MSHQTNNATFDSTLSKAKRRRLRKQKAKSRKQSKSKSQSHITNNNNHTPEHEQFTFISNDENHEIIKESQTENSDHSSLISDDDIIDCCKSPSMDSSSHMPDLSYYESKTLSQFSMEHELHDHENDHKTDEQHHNTQQNVFDAHFMVINSCTVRETQSISSVHSPPITVLTPGTIVICDDTMCSANRIKIKYPVVGWISIRAQSGLALIVPPPNGEHINMDECEHNFLFNGNPIVDNVPIPEWFHMMWLYDHDHDHGAIRIN